MQVNICYALRHPVTFFSRCFRPRFVNSVVSPAKPQLPLNQRIAILQAALDYEIGRAQFELDYLPGLVCGREDARAVRLRNVLVANLDNCQQLKILLNNYKDSK